MDDSMKEIRWFLTALLLLFIGLRLGGVIEWSWWWVLSPFWIPLALGLFGTSLVWMSERMMSKEQRNMRQLKRALHDYADSLRRR